MSKGIFDAVIDFSTTDLVAKYGLQKGGPVQQAVTVSAIRYMSDYTPFKTGTLANSPWTVSDFAGGVIIYPGPYAHYMYYGEVYGPNFPVEVDAAGNVIQWRSRKGERKHPTGRLLQYKKDRNPLAGSHWCERMKADHMQDIVAEAKAVAGVK